MGRIKSWTVAAVAAGALATGGHAACGDDDNGDAPSADDVQNQIDDAQNQAEEAQESITQATEDAKQEAQQQKDEANKQLDEAQKEIQGTDGY